jgi:hypothetical protein
MMLCSSVLTQVHTQEVTLVGRIAKEKRMSVVVLTGLRGARLLVRGPQLVCDWTPLIYPGCYSHAA